MKALLSKLEPRDLVALLIIAGAIATNWRGGSVMVPASVMLIVGFYFGAAHRQSQQTQINASKTNDAIVQPAQPIVGEPKN